MAADQRLDNAWNALRGGGPIFPAGVWTGMTMREYFAGQALSAHLADLAQRTAETTDMQQRESLRNAICRECYAWADAMLRAGEHHE
jgi:hypothetical protein